MTRSRFAQLALAALFTLGSARSPRAQVIDLTVNDVGLAIGDKPRVTGLRINYRDRNLVEANGVNLTLWSPYTPATGTVNGLALGVPVTGAKVINGFAVGALGVGADESITGLGLGLVGLGSGGRLRGIMIGGIGVGSAGGAEGITIGGIGVGSGGTLRGIQIGGIGVGGGGDVVGISVGGIGVGGSGNVRGLAIGGVGVGGGGSFTGIGIGGIGVGGAGNMTGLMIGGIGVGSGGRIKGVGLGGVGVGAPTIEGVAIGGIGVGGHDVHAMVLTGAYFKVDSAGSFRGGALAAVNNIRGQQRGLVLGLFNYARELHGTQIGLINVSDNDGSRRVLPIISVR
jgi:hypothetical protein